MKKIMCSYGTPDYSGSLNNLSNTAFNIGKIDKFDKYTREWLVSTEFYKNNKYILDKQRGGGYWLYKINCILESFNNSDLGDVIMYVDAGMQVINDLTPLYDLTDKNEKLLFVLPGGHINRTWTKKDCFVLMGCDTSEYHNSRQTQAAISLWKNCDENRTFLNEWLKFMRDPRISTDDPNFCGQNYPGFKDHRHDQSVLSLLCVKYKIERFRDPTQWGNGENEQLPNSTYPQLFNHHRQKL